MAKQKKHFLKIIIVIVSLVVLVALTIGAVQFVNFLSAKPYCTKYTEEQTKAKQLTDRDSTALNDSCLQERGWGS